MIYFATKKRKKPNEKENNIEKVKNFDLVLLHTFRYEEKTKKRKNIPRQRLLSAANS